MALHTLSTAFLLTSLLFPLFIQRSYSFNVMNVSEAEEAPTSDVDNLEFQLNLEHLYAEYFLFGTTGRGLDAIAPELAQGGPPPVGGKSANLDPFIKDVFLQFVYQKVSHLRAIRRLVGGFPRPLLNISRGLFAELVDQAIGRRLQPPFDPYANSLNYVLGAYVISYVAPTGYVGITPELQNATFKRFVGGILGVEFGQDAVTRAYLYERVDSLIPPYPLTVAGFTKVISDLGNRLGKEGTKSEGLEVPPSEGAGGKVSGNVLAANNDSIAYARLPRVILRIIYGSGNESVPGGFYPKGANGRIARSFLSVAP